MIHQVPYNYFNLHNLITSQMLAFLFFYVELHHENLWVTQRLCSCFISMRAVRAADWWFLYQVWLVINLN